MKANPYREIEEARPPAARWRVQYLESATSTQDVAAELARRGADSGTVVIAEAQSAGRGRKGHRWFSPPGANLYMTIILRPRIAPAELSRLSLAAGVAVAQALENVAPGLVALKWPNDIWLREKKAGGILAQTMNLEGLEPAVVLLGIGLNVNLEAREFPPELRRSATSVRIEVGAPCDRVKLVAALLEHLHKIVEELETEGFGRIRARWQKLSALTGKNVRVLDCGAEVAGKVMGIDDDGALLLKTESEDPVRLRAGEITFADLSGG